MSEQNLYHVLGISETATPSEIKKAYRSQAKKYHPDHNPKVPPEAIKEINNAWSILGDETLRAVYDKTLKENIVREPRASNEYHRPSESNYTQQRQPYSPIPPQHESTTPQQPGYTCFFCGKQNRAGAAFCGRCGKSFGLNDFGNINNQKFNSAEAFLYNSCRRNAVPQIDQEQPFVDNAVTAE